MTFTIFGLVACTYADRVLSIHLYLFTYANRTVHASLENKIYVFQSRTNSQFHFKRVKDTFKPHLSGTCSSNIRFIRNSKMFIISFYINNYIFKCTIIIFENLFSTEPQ